MSQICVISYILEYIDTIITTFEFLYDASGVTDKDM